GSTSSTLRRSRRCARITSRLTSKFSAAAIAPQPSSSTYSFARVGAAVAMRVEDYYGQGKRWWVRLHEKGGKRHEMPAHHNLEAYLDAYIEAAKLGEAKKSPLFRSARGRTGELTGTTMHRIDVYRMIRRRARDAGLDPEI